MENNHAPGYADQFWKVRGELSTQKLSNQSVSSQKEAWKAGKHAVAANGYHASKLDHTYYKYGTLE